LHDEVGAFAQAQLLQAREGDFIEAAIAASGLGVEDDAAADGGGRGGQTQDVMITADRDEVGFELELHKTFPAWGEGFHAQEAHACQRFAGAGEDFQAYVVPDLHDGITKQADGGIQTCGWGVVAWVGDDIAAVDILGCEVVEVDGSAVTGGDFLQLAIVVLQTADAARLACWQADNLIAKRKAAIQQGAGDNRAKAGKREDTVHRQTRAIEIALWGSLG